MPKPRLKTTATRQRVTAFYSSITEPEQRRDARTIARIMRTVTGKRPVMWGPGIVGYGRYHYKYASGREGEYFRTGFAPRKGTLVIYIMPGYTNFDTTLKDLGKYRKGKSCLYIKRLADVDTKVLEKLIRAGWKDMEKRYGKA